MKFNELMTLLESNESIETPPSIESRVDEMTDEELDAFMVSEEFEQLDELDQKTLKSYLEKRGNEVIPKVFTNKAKDDPNFEKKVVGVSRSLDKIKEDVEDPDVVMNPYTKYLDTNPFASSNPFYVKESSMSDVHYDISRNLDKHINQYKKNGGGDAFGTKIEDAVAKIAKLHSIHPDSARELVHQYVNDKISN